MSRYRLVPTAAQAEQMQNYCAQARAVWNAALQQRNHWKVCRKPAPGFAEQCRQLTEARAALDWLAAGSVVAQQQALRDLDQAFRNFFAGTHGYPTWRKRGKHEGFRIVGVARSHISRLNRTTGTVWIPGIGSVRFRWSRVVPETKSYRITFDAVGRWHIAFACIPGPIPGPGTGEVVGIDRGVAVSVMTSDGEAFDAPTLTSKEQERLLHLQRRLSRACKGSNRRRRVKLSIARLRARERDRRTDWIEQTTTILARRYDGLMLEDLKVRSMTKSARGTMDRPGRYVRQKAGLNRSILAQGWGQLVKRLEQKAPGRVGRVAPRYTSQRCSMCGHVAPENRKSQAAFRCVACGFTCNADHNAAENIAVGHTVTARGAFWKPSGAMKREPQGLVLSG